MLFHEFHPPPYGGGNQFLLALVGELERRGLRSRSNRSRVGPRPCLFNSFNFDFTRLERFARDSLRMVHRVDGPVGVYRGFDDGTDGGSPPINRKLADATILQSTTASRSIASSARAARSRRDSERRLPGDLSSRRSRRASRGRRVRVIATSWSDNPRKGADVLAWLDHHLDFDSFEVTFAGNTTRRSSAFTSSPRWHRKRLRISFAHTTSTSRRAATIRLRMHCSRGSPAVCLLPTCAAADIRNWSARLESASTTRRSCRPCWRDSRPSSTSADARSVSPSLAEVADRYLEVLRA